MTRRRAEVESLGRSCSTASPDGPLRTEPEALATVCLFPAGDDSRPNAPSLTLPARLEQCNAPSLTLPARLARHLQDHRDMTRRRAEVESLGRSCSTASPDGPLRTEPEALATVCLFPAGDDSRPNAPSLTLPARLEQCNAPSLTLPAPLARHLQDHRDLTRRRAEVESLGRSCSTASPDGPLRTEPEALATVCLFPAGDDSRPNAPSLTLPARLEQCNAPSLTLPARLEQCNAPSLTLPARLARHLQDHRESYANREQPAVLKLVRLLGVLLSTFLVLLGAGLHLAQVRAQEPGGQPATASAPAPAAAELLRTVPFDRIVLSDNSVLIVDPVSPRPLPPIDIKKARETEGAAEEFPVGGNIGLPGEPSKIKAAKKKPEEGTPQADDSTQIVKIHLMDNVEIRDYTIKRTSIRSIEYFEDMLLAEADRLVLARDFARAFECLLRVKSRNPSWAGIDDHVNKLLYAEGSAALIAGDSEKGLRLLRELVGRNRDYPGLMDQLSSAYGGWVSRAMELRQYARGRRYLHELEEMAPDHRGVRAIRDRFVKLAREKVTAAEALEGPARLDTLADALRTWPDLEGGKDLYVKAFESVPTLVVAVDDVPYPVGPWIRSPADARTTRLLYLPILEADSDDARQGKIAGQLAGSMESADLGRRLNLRIRPGTVWSDGSRNAAAVDVARSLIDRTDPGSNRFQARWADVLDRVAATDESNLEIRLKRPLVKSGAWFQWPVGPAHAGIDGRIATTGLERILVTDGPFRCKASTAEGLEMIRPAGVEKTTSPDASSAGSSLRVMRIREVRVARPQTTVTALLQGDVSLASHVPPDQVEALRANPEIRVGRYASPRSHVLAIDARNPLLRNRSLRRGLSYAIARKALLEETVLRHPTDDTSDVADGAFSKGSYANAPDVRPLEYNPTLAIMLVAGARKEMGGSPIELKLEYPGIPEARAVMPRLTEALGQTGIKIQAVEVPESKLESELRSGRRFDLAYRALRCDEPILDAGLMLCPGYDAPPQADALASAASPRILQLLLQLDRATEVSTARGLAIQLDRESRDELPVIPLWYAADHYAWRTRLKGPAETAESLYQDLAGWEIQPWFARDPWSKP